MSHRGMHPKDVDGFDTSSLQGKPSDIMATQPMISLRTAGIIAVTLLMAVAVFGFGR